MKTESMVLVARGRVEVTDVDVAAPGPGEVLIETKAAGICRGDTALFAGELNYGYPFFHGHEPVGIVAEVGPGVSGFEPGDRVACLGGPSFRRHVVTPTYQVARIPDEPADLVLWVSEPPACAVNGVAASDFRPGQKVALLGCGYMGLLVLQTMPHETFGRFLVAEPNEKRRELARSLGAEETYDPNETDLPALARDIGGFDIVVEASGARGAIALATKMLRNGGTLNLFGWHPGEEAVPTHDWHYMGLRVLNTAPGFSPDFTVHFRASVALIGTGRIDQRPLITHRFPLDECQRAFEVAANREDGYMKGVITF